MLKFFSLLVLALALGGCVTIEKNLRRFEYTRPDMGVPFRIVMYAPSESAANEAAEAAFKRVSQLNDIMSDYEYDSELSRLSRTSGKGQAVKVSDELWTVLQMSQKISRASDGARPQASGPNNQRRPRSQ